MNVMQAPSHDVEEVFLGFYLGVLCDRKWWVVVPVVRLMSMSFPA